MQQDRSERGSSGSQGRDAGEKAISRRDMLRTGGQLLAATSLGSLLASCGGTSTSGSTTASGSPASGVLPRPGGSLTAAIAAEPDVLDPAKSSLSAAAEIYDHIFDTLVEMDDEGNIVPSLATEYRTPDDRTYVMDLAEGVTFHNGEPFTAEDVKYTFERILDKRVASPYASQFASLDRVEVVSPLRVRFRLKEPNAAFLTSLVVRGQIVNRKAIEQGDAARRPIGTGPLEFVEWVKGSHVQTRANADYFEPDVPYLEEIRFVFTPITNARVQGLEAKSLDWVDDVPAIAIRKVERNSALSYVTADDTGRPQFLAFNTGSGATASEPLRRAIAHAIDRQQIHDVVFLGTGQVGSAEVATGSPWYTPGDDPYADGPDLDQARALMEEAGLAGGVSLEYITYTGSDYPAKVGELLRSQLQEIGIDLKIQQMDISVWLDRILGKKYEMTMVFQEGVIDPDNFYSVLLKSNAPSNIYDYNDSRFDALVEDAVAETDFERRKELYAQVRAQVYDDVPLLFVHYLTPNYVMGKDVVGSRAWPSQKLRLQFAGFAG